MEAIHGMHYFDHNATTPLSEAGRRAWLDAVDRFPGNPSSPHRMGSRAERALTEAREALASRLGCSPFDLVWTSGATEAVNMVFHHYAKRLPKSAVVWVSAIEHPCVLQAAEAFLGVGRVRRIPAMLEGTVALDWLEAQEIRPALVAIMAANNETGVLQPWEKCRQWCQERRIPFLCDAAQWMGKMPAAGLGRCDWAIGCAHKFGGPAGVGFLKCPAEEVVEPLLVGGHQELSRRAGTENVAGVLAMAAASEERESLLSTDWMDSRRKWQSRFEESILELLPGTQVLGQGTPRLWNTISMVMPACGRHFRWVVKLDRLGFAVSTGSACASGKEKPSHVLKAMQRPINEASRTIRCSSGPKTNEQEWTDLAAALSQIGKASRLHPSKHVN